MISDFHSCSVVIHSDELPLQSFRKLNSWNVIDSHLNLTSEWLQFNNRWAYSHILCHIYTLCWWLQLSLRRNDMPRHIHTVYPWPPWSPVRALAESCDDARFPGTWDPWRTLRREPRGSQLPPNLTWSSTPWGHKAWPTVRDEQERRDPSWRDNFSFHRLFRGPSPLYEYKAPAGFYRRPVIGR